MEFDWDSGNLMHIALHQVTAAEVEYALRHPTLELEFQQQRDEDRFSEVGMTGSGRVLVIITTVRGLKIRVITAYNAGWSLEQAYHASRRWQ